MSNTKATLKEGTVLGIISDDLGSKLENMDRLTKQILEKVNKIYSLDRLESLKEDDTIDRGDIASDLSMKVNRLGDYNDRLIEISQLLDQIV